MFECGLSAAREILNAIGEIAKKTLALVSKKKNKAKLVCVAMYVCMYASVHGENLWVCMYVCMYDYHIVVSIKTLFE